MDKTYDDELVGKWIQVVGHIHILKADNAMFSMHIFEPAFNSLNGFDPISSEPFNSQSSNHESINP